MLPLRDRGHRLVHQLLQAQIPEIRLGRQQRRPARHPDQPRRPAPPSPRPQRKNLLQSRGEGDGVFHGEESRGAQKLRRKNRRRQR